MIGRSLGGRGLGVRRRVSGGDTGPTPILDYDFTNWDQATFDASDIVSTLTTTRTLFDSTGTLVYAPHQLLENANLGTRTGDLPSGWAWTAETGSVVWTDPGSYSQGVFSGTTQQQALINQVTLAAGTVYTAVVFIEQSAITAGNGIILRCVNSGGTDGDITDADWDSLGGVAGRYGVAFEMGVADTEVNFRVGLGVAANATGSVTMSRLGVVKGNITGTNALNTPAKIDEPFLTQGGWVGTNNGDEPLYLPRLGYHVFENSSWVDKGLGVWSATTNEVHQSEDFGTTWTETGTSVVSTNTTAAPDGNTTADTLTDDNASGLEFITSNAATSANSETWTFSLFVLQDAVAPSTRFPVIVVSFAGGTATSVNLGINTVDGSTETVVSGTGTVIGSGSEDIGGTYWRCWVTFKNNATGNTSVTGVIAPARGANADLVTGSDAATGSIVAWGAMLHEDDIPMPYIATTTAAVAVSADIHTQLISTVAGFSQSAMSVYADFYIARLQSTGLRTIIDIADSDSSDKVALTIQSGGGGNDLEWASTHSSDTDGSVVNSNAITADTSFKSISMAADDDFNSTLDGATVGNDNSAAFPLATNLVTVRYGSNSAGNYQNGILGRSTIYNTRLSDATGQNIATSGP